MPILTAKEFAALAGKLPQHLDTYFKWGKIIRESGDKPRFDTENEVNATWLAEMQLKKQKKGKPIKKPSKVEKAKKVAVTPKAPKIAPKPIPSEFDEDINPRTPKTKTDDQNNQNQELFNIKKLIDLEELERKKQQNQLMAIQVETAKHSLIPIAPVLQQMKEIVRAFLVGDVDINEREMKFDAVLSGWANDVIVAKRKKRIAALNKLADDVLDTAIRKLKKISA